MIRSNIHQNTKWIQSGVTVAGGNGQGNKLNQLFQPQSIYVNDDDQSIYVGDYGNQRVVEWKRGATNGQIVAGGNGKGNKPNQIHNPTGVIIDKERKNLIICDVNNRRVVLWPLRNGTSGQTITSDINCCGLAMDIDGYIYISNLEKNEVRRWKIGDTSGTLVAGGNGKGNRLNQLDWPTHIFIGDDHSVYVSDHSNHRVMKWIKGANKGIVVAGGQGKGSSFTQLSGPQGLIVDQLDALYVADSDNDRIMRWRKGDKEGSIVVGGNGRGEQANQLNDPIDLSFDRDGNLYVLDKGHNRVQRFDIDRI
jgi:DNA-binding beta-propeller fold protein YncE